MTAIVVTARHVWEWGSLPCPARVLKVFSIYSAYCLFITWWMCSTYSYVFHLSAFSTPCFSPASRVEGNVFAFCCVYYQVQMENADL